jgi:hypothetical protein
MKCGPRQSIADATTSRQTTRQDLRSASGEDPVDCPINDHNWDSRSLPFPRTRSRSVPDVMNDHLVVPDLIHDQIVANRKSQEAALPCRSTDMRGSRNARSRMFNSSNETACGLPICPQRCTQKSHRDRQVRHVHIGASCTPIAAEHLFDLFFARQIAAHGSTSRTNRATFS